jgi:hypothetical protein
MLSKILKIIKNQIEELTYEATMSADDGDVYDFKSFVLNADVKLRFKILAVILGKRKFNQLLGIRE